MLLLINALGASLVISAPPVLNKQNIDPSYYLEDSTKVDSVQLIKPLTSESALKSKVTYTAVDSIKFNIKEQKAYLYGQAQVFFETTTLSADYIELDMGENLVFASGVKDSVGELQGKPIFKDEDQEFTTKTINYNFKTKKGLITDVITHEGEGYIHMDTAMKYSDNTLFIKSGAYTTCDQENPHFAIHSTIIKIIPDDKIIMGPAYLSIANIPTPLVLPFGLFPNTKGRSSGVLIPTYGESQIAGFFLKDGGYYFGLNDNLDLALRADIYSKGSWGASLYSNYKKRYGYNGNLSIRYSEFKIGETELPTFSLEKDFFITWTHNQDSKAKPGSRFSAKVNAGSSSYNRFNSNFSANYLTNTFQSNVSYSKSWTRMNFSANLRHSQNTINKTVTLNLPDLVFSINRVSIGDLRKKAAKRSIFDNFGLNYRMDASNRISTFDSLLFTETTLQDFNNGIKHNVSGGGSFKILKYFLLNPSFTATNRMYFQSINKVWVDSTDINPGFVRIDTVRGFQAATDYSLRADLRTKIYATLQFKKFPITAIRHLITPSIGWSFRPDYGENKFGYYKTVKSDEIGGTETYSIFNGGPNAWTGIYGSPSTGKFGSITFRVINNVQMKVRTRKDSLNQTKKLKLIENLTFSTSYNMALDSLRWAPILVNGYTRLLSNKLYLRYNARLDPYVLVSDPSGITKNVNRLEWRENNRIARLEDSDWNLSLNTQIDPNMFKNKKQVQEKKKSNKGTKEELEMINNNPDEYIDFSIPWNVNLGYTLRYTSNYFYQNSRTLDSISHNLVQTLGFRGELNLTEKWRIAFRSGYDIKNKAFTSTIIDVFRDLHCWEMAFNYIPFGFQQSYNFTIRVKSSILQDLKLTRKRQWFDNGLN